MPVYWAVIILTGWIGTSMEDSKAIQGILRPTDTCVIVSFGQSFVEILNLNLQLRIN